MKILQSLVLFHQLNTNAQYEKIARLIGGITNEQYTNYREYLD
jgi:hypothetical protein